MEKVVKAMSRKVLNLEEEIVKMKEDRKLNKDNELKMLFIETKSTKSKQDKFKCEKCEYDCKKESTQQNHTNTKHMGQECIKKNKNSANIQDSDKKNESNELSLTQRVKDSRKSFVFSESMLDKFL